MTLKINSATSAIYAVAHPPKRQLPEKKQSRVNGIHFWHVHSTHDVWTPCRIDAIGFHDLHSTHNAGA